MSKYNVITLCGSTKFKDEFMKLQKDLTLKGNIVLNLGIFFKSETNSKIDEKTMQMLSNMHMQKIDMCDEIFVVNVNGYIGQSTKKEIEYAKKLGKKISYLEPIK